jgi:hypothetical protein
MYTSTKHLKKRSVQRETAMHKRIGFCSEEEILCFSKTHSILGAEGIESRVRMWGRGILHRKPRMSLEPLSYGVIMAA